MTPPDSAAAVRSGRQPRGVLAGDGRRLLAAAQGGSSRLTWIALAVMLLLAATLLYSATRGTTLWVDEWSWALGRRGSSLDTFLRPHNGHLSLVPVAIYKLLFVTAGLHNYAPYRMIVIGVHLACVTLLFVYARSRVGSFLALLAAALLLFFGPGWQNILWPFQVAWLISLACGIGALLMLDRDERAGNVAACALLAVSLASSGIGVPVAIGLITDVLCRPRPSRRAWIVGVPVALYVLWSLAYQDTTLARHGIVVATGFAARSAASALSALIGLGGTLMPQQSGYGGTLLEWGPPLAVAATACLIWRVVRLRALPPRVFAVIGMAASFWLLTGLSRWYISEPFESRYLYVGALLILLLAVELARGVPTAWPTRAVLGVVALAAVVTNAGGLRAGAAFLRNQAELTRAQVAAFDFTRAIVAPTFGVGPFGIIDARHYFLTEGAIGSPAATPAQLLAESENARQAADAELTDIHRVSLRPSTGAAVRLGPRPTVDARAGGSIIAQPGCAAFTPAPFKAANAPAAELALTVPPGGLLIRIDGAAAQAGLRRFAVGFQALGTLVAGSTSTLQIAADQAPQPWHVQLTPAGRATVCGLGR